jgi:hypothetical protein
MNSQPKSFYIADLKALPLKKVHLAGDTHLTEERV